MIDVIADPGAVTFPDWMGNQGNVPAGQEGPLDDANRDGVSKPLASYLGRTAMENAAGALPWIRIGNGRAYVEFWRADGITGVTAHVERSPDGSRWEAGPPIVPVADLDGRQLVQADLGPVAGRLLARLQVSLAATPGFTR